MGTTTNMALTTFASTDPVDYNVINSNSNKIDAAYKETIDTIGKLINKNGWCTEFTASTSMDGVLTTGFYFSSAWTGAPNGSAYGYLICIALSPAKKQIFFAHGANEVYVRTFRGGQWYEWGKLANGNAFENFVNSSGHTATFSGDLNTLIIPGMYYCTNLINPPGSSTYGYVIVMRHNTNSVKQIYYGYHNNFMYVRYMSGGSWEAWTVYHETKGTTVVTHDNTYCTMTASWTVSNGICVCDFTMTPKTAISSSTGAVTFSELPTPIQGTKALVYNADDMHCCKVSNTNTVVFEGGSYTNGTKYYSTVYYRIN